MKKFNKFFSTISIVMIASSLTLGPMTLRAEDTTQKQVESFKTLLDEDIRESTKELIKQLIDKLNKKEFNNETKELLAKIRKALLEEKEINNQKIKEADERIKKADEEIKEAKEKQEESNKMYCNTLNVTIPQMKNYCSKNKCTEEQNKILAESLKDYKEKCKTLVAPAPEEKKEKK